MTTYTEKNSISLTRGATDPNGDTILVRRINDAVISSWPHVVSLAVGAVSVTEDGTVVYDDSGTTDGHPAASGTLANGSFTFRLWDGTDESAEYTATVGLEGQSGGSLAAVTSASSHTFNGITYNFNKVVQAGTSVSGRPFIVDAGGVTITSTSPASSGGANGLMKNFATATTDSKNTSHGFTSGVSQPSYSSAVNVDPGNSGTALTVSAGDVIIKAVTSGTVQDYHVLHCVSTIPNVNAFSPPTHGGTGWTPTLIWSDALLANLGSETPTASMSAPSTFMAANNIEGVQQLFWEGSDETRNLSPSNGLWNYGSAIGRVFGDALAILNADYTDAQKRSLAIQMIQHGIDVLGHVSVVGGSSYDTTFKSNAGLPASTPGRVYKGGGGNNAGPDLAAIFAAAMLNDTTLTAALTGDPRHYNFSDCFHYITQVDDVGRTLKVIGGVDSWRGRTYHYETGHVGFPDWNIQHNGPPALSWEGPQNDNANPAKNYHGIAADAYFTGALALAQISNAKTLAGNDAFFDWMDRYASLISPTDYAQSSGNLATAIIDKDNGVSAIGKECVAAGWQTANGRTPWVGKPEIIYPPTVSGGGGSITVTQPTVVNHGAAITQWDVRHRSTSTTTFGANGDVYSRSEDQDGASGWTETNAISWNGSSQYVISGLGAGAYRVQVRARNATGTGPWSTNNLKITQDTGAGRAVVTV